MKNKIYKIIGITSGITFILGNMGFIQSLFESKDFIPQLFAVIYLFGIISIWLCIQEEFRKKNELIIYYKKQLYTKSK